MPSGMQGAKHTVLEGGIRNFLAVSGPGIPQGSTSYALTGLVDVLPTIVDLASLKEVSKRCQGVSTPLCSHVLLCTAYWGVPQGLMADMWHADSCCFDFHIYCHAEHGQQDSIMQEPIDCQFGRPTQVKQRHSTAPSSCYAMHRTLSCGCFTSVRQHVVCHGFTSQVPVRDSWDGISFANLIRGEAATQQQQERMVISMETDCVEEDFVPLLGSDRWEDGEGLCALPGLHMLHWVHC